MNTEIKGRKLCDKFSREKTKHGTHRADASHSMKKQNMQ
jgi:hypothetical protein